MGRVAYFVSPHGFGHAARACAVMAEMVRRRPGIHFHVYTEVPQWFFSESLPKVYTYHPCACDVGLVQRSPLIEDLGATVTRLDQVADHGSGLKRMTDGLRQLRCQLVIADISPLGLRIAEAASVPSVLVENFTWDWIYHNHADAPPPLREHGRALSEIFAAAHLRIQTEPVCQTFDGAVQVPPVARSARLGRSAVRRRLGVPSGQPLVVVSMGGVPWDYGVFSQLEHADGPWIVVPGGCETEPKQKGRLLLLPFHADVYHPDLVAASDVVVSKLGYSTVAEAYGSGCALLYVARPRFPESPVLARWVEEHMVAAEIREEELANEGWLEVVGELLKRPRQPSNQANGAEEAAEVIVERFASCLD